jgi:hypothetical protein
VSGVASRPFCSCSKWLKQHHSAYLLLPLLLASTPRQTSEDKAMVELLNFILQVCMKCSELSCVRSPFLWYNTPPLPSSCQQACGADSDVVPLDEAIDSVDISDVVRICCLLLLLGEGFGPHGPAFGCGETLSSHFLCMLQVRDVVETMQSQKGAVSYMMLGKTKKHAGSRKNFIEFWKRLIHAAAGDVLFGIDFLPRLVDWWIEISR